MAERLQYKAELRNDWMIEMKWVLVQELTIDSFPVAGLMHQL